MAPGMRLIYHGFAACLQEQDMGGASGVDVGNS
jgi:hypothetical protein